MPYIKQEQRDKLDHIKRTIDLLEIQNPGDLNYLITSLIKSYIDQRPESYQYYNDVMGALEGAKLEVYRRSISKYEDGKIIENGDV